MIDKCKYRFIHMLVDQVQVPVAAPLLLDIGFDGACGE